MVNIITWVKNNRLVSLLIVIILYLLLKGSVPSGSPFYRTSSNVSMYNSESAMDSVSMGAPSSGGIDMGRGKSIAPIPPITGSAPRPDVADRKVVTNSNVSVVVKDVRESVNKIADEVKSKKGYVVNKFINTPEISETGSIVVRVPSNEVDNFLNSIRNLATKVVYENISSDDITDQYVDVQERLNVLTANKTRFEEIMKSATNVDEILRVQQQIFALQDQIDSYKGQLQYLDGTSTTSLITINLSTDEISLPYTPEAPFRPEVIFKEAVRSLIIDLRWAATWLIWAAVYAALWLPLLGIGLIGYSIYRKRKSIERNV